MGTTDYIFYGLVALFVLLVVIYVGWAFISDLNQRSSQTYAIVDGTQLARSPMTIPGSKIRPSQGGAYGIEFTYLTWLYVNNIMGKEGHYEPIFVKGSPNGDEKGLPYLCSPAIMLGPNGNELTVAMNVLKSTDTGIMLSDDESARQSVELITVDNIPMDKWVQIGVVLMNDKLDIYINDELRIRKKLTGIPDINNGDLYVASNNGFDGFISNAVYYAQAVPYYKIDQHFRGGPSQKPCTITGSKPPYFADTYWTNNGSIM